MVSKLVRCFENGGEQRGERNSGDLARQLRAEYHPVVVRLLKKVNGKGLGFSIVGGVDSPLGPLAFYVRTVHPGGLAADDGTLRQG